MTKQDKIDRLTQLFIESRRAMSKGFKWTVNATKAQCDILFEIHNGAHRAADLAKILQTTPSAVTQLINQVVDEGYVTRTHSSTDRREIQLELTSKGSEVIDHIHKHVRERATDIVSVLTDDEIEQFMKINRKIADYTNKKEV